MNIFSNLLFFILFGMATICFIFVNTTFVLVMAGPAPYIITTNMIYVLVLSFFLAWLADKVKNI